MSKPRIRFKGYTDDWEQRKLGNIAQDTFGGGTPKTSVTEYWNGDIPWIQSSDLTNEKLFGVSPKKYITKEAVKNSATKLIPANSIAIVTRVGVGKLAFMPFEFTSSQDFLSLSNLIIDCNFGMYSIYKMLQRELNNIQGTSIKGITKADLLDKDVVIPVDIEEQQKIGQFFKKLDDTIALHQRKLELLKEQKKGFLQKMFPKNGQSVPEIRFAGFTGDWEQCKLTEVAQYRNGKAHEKNIIESSPYIVVNSKFVSTNGSVKKYSDNLIEPLFSREIAFVLSDIPNGRALARTFLVNEDQKYSLNQRIAGITPFEFTDSYFLNILMNRNSYFLKFDSGVGQTNLSKDQVESFTTFYPVYEEQQKLGQFFKKLDDTIALHQRKLDKLNQTKQAFLQKMFV